MFILHPRTYKSGACECGLSWRYTFGGQQHITGISSHNTAFFTKGISVVRENWALGHCNIQGSERKRKNQPRRLKRRSQWDRRKTRECCVLQAKWKSVSKRREWSTVPNPADRQAKVGPGCWIWQHDGYCSHLEWTVKSSFVGGKNLTKLVLMENGKK